MIGKAARTWVVDLRGEKRARRLRISFAPLQLTIPPARDLRQLIWRGAEPLPWVHLVWPRSHQRGVVTRLTACVDAPTLEH